MSGCVNFDESTFIFTLNQINDTITNGEFLDNLKSLASEPCSISGGSKHTKTKRKRKLKKSRKMRGGKIPIKTIIKTLLYVIVAILVGLGFNSPNLQTVTDGLLMIYNGQCNTIQNRIWSWVGMENPLCVMYNDLLFKVLPNALLGNAEALQRLVGMFTIGFGGPVAVIRQIDYIGELLENTVNNTLSIPNSDNNADIIEEVSSTAIVTRGGSKIRKKRN